VIASHGDYNGIAFSSGDVTLNALGQTSLKKNCFFGLASDAEIILESCNTGKEKNGIASAIAIQSKRVVWAPKSTISTFYYKFSADTPPIPTFLDHTKFSQLQTLAFVVNKNFTSVASYDITCKFYPDGTSTCNV
nr:hypothetical protein [Parachlamydiaceae bacterium]